MIKTHVKKLAGAGFALLPLRPNTKRPYASDWTTAPVLSAEELLRTLKPTDNLGVRLGEPSKVGGGYLHCFDLDIKSKDERADAIAQMDEYLPEWRTFPTVKSGYGLGSRHIYFVSDEPFRKITLDHSPNKVTGKDEKPHWAWEIQVFGTGNQVVLPPSIHPVTGDPYVWEREFDFEIIDLGLVPFVSADRIRRLKPSIHEKTTENTSDLADFVRSRPLELTLKEVREILADLDKDRFVTDRDGWWRVGMALHHQFEGSEEGYDEWVRFSLQDEGKFDERDQKRVWKSFGKRSNPTTFRTLIKESGWVQTVKEPDDEEPEDSEGDEDSAVDEEDTRRPWEILRAKKHKTRRDRHIDDLNKEHAVVDLNGKTKIITERPGRPPTYGDVQSFHSFYANRRIKTGDEGNTTPVSKLWQESPARRSYNGVTFDPTETDPDIYNTWKGFSVEPDPTGSCRLYLRHLRTIICCGNEEHYDWLIKYFAHMLQKPNEKPGVAIVLRGPKGTGKDTVGEYFGEIVKAHYHTISNSKHLVGNFNAHLAKTLFLHVEESFWGGDRSAESSLKALITSPTASIEPKGVDVYQVKSFLRIFMSSNEDWAVPASDDERRYFVLDVSNKRAQDAVYFDALREEMNNGGPAALMHFLLNVDLTGFNVRKPPETEGLLNQKLQSLRNFEKWWFDILYTGNLPTENSHFAEDADSAWGKDGVYVPCHVFRESYEEYVGGNRFSGVKISEADFGKKMKSLIPGFDKRQPFGRKNRTYAYWIPPMKVCRDAFAVYMRHPMKWDGDDDIADLLG